MTLAKRILLITGLLLALASSLSAVQSDNWVKVAPPGGGFSVMMPAEPKELETKPTADFTSHTYALTADGVIYVCLYGDYASSVRLNPDGELVANRDNFLKALNASLLTTKKIELDGRAGLEFTGESAQSNLQSRVYIFGNRVYQIAVATAKGTDESGAARFLQSFAFADNKEHIRQ